MQIIETVKDMQDLSRRFRSEGGNIGFVPTMGAIHDGHLSLIQRSVDENNVTVVSIFVNPKQFGPEEDIKKYPRETEIDLKKLSPLNVDAVFVPGAGEMYKNGDSLTVDVGRTGRILCGLSRPGHFNAVATVVAKLFNIVMPDKAYFGQKDYQQTVVIRNLVKDLNFDIDVVMCPTVREDDGLAISSRNRYLNRLDRVSALILFKALKFGEELILSNGEYDAVMVRKEINRIISSEPKAVTEFVEVVDPVSLERIEKITGPVVIAVAVRINDTRLIDNLLVAKL
jgi:pantoate--beta-alanine ligase